MRNLGTVTWALAHMERAPVLLRDPTANVGSLLSSPVPTTHPNELNTQNVQSYMYYIEKIKELYVLY